MKPGSESKKTEAPSDKTDVPEEDTSSGRVKWLVARDVRLFRDEAGHVRATVRGKCSIVRPALLRAFPITAPDRLIELREEQGDSVGMLRDLTSLDDESRQLAESILRGQIDFALTETPPAHNQLRTDAFTTLHYGVYCHAAHKLAKLAKLKIEQVLDHPFAIPPDNDPAYPSPWPAQHLRTNVMVVDDMNMAIRACHTENVLAVLPAVLSSGLQRLPINVFSPRTLYAVYREPIGDQERMQAVMTTLSDLNIS